MLNVYAKLHSQHFTRINPLNLPNNPKRSIIIFHLTKRDLKQPAQTHAACIWQGPDENPGIWNIKGSFFTALKKECTLIHEAIVLLPAAKDCSEFAQAQILCVSHVVYTLLV